MKITIRTISVLFAVCFFSLSLNEPVYSSYNSDYTRVQSEQKVPAEPVSLDYEVFIDGVKAVVYTARTQDTFPVWDKKELDHGGIYSFVSFDVKNKPVEVRIQSRIVSVGYRQDFHNVIIRPDNPQIKNYVNKDNVITFTVDKPVKLSIEPNGKHGPLLLFANPAIDYKPDLNDKNLVYFGPGIHKPNPEVIELKDNQTLYLDEGAIVKAGVHITGDNVTICGRGILCGNEFTWQKHDPHMILVEGNNAIVKDIIIRGAASWTIPVRECHNVTIDNVKLLGGRNPNDDGINPVNAQDVTIKNCFIRSDDDCIAVKGTFAPPRNISVERITIENTILWCDKAKTILLGHESRAPFMKDIIFRNIDVIHMGHHSFVLEPGEGMVLQNVLFENFRINGNGQNDIISIRPVINQYMKTKTPGYVKDITFRNVQVTGLPGKYRIAVGGYDEKYDVAGVTFSNFSLLGEKINNTSKYLQVDKFVSNLSFK